MKASELRLYNWCSMHGMNICVNGQDMIGILKNDYELNPIKITEEWLIKFGFDDKHQTFQKDGFQVDGTVIHFSFDKWRSNYDIEHCDFVEIPQEIKYVHQLQNLYFSLTGVELELSSNVA